MATDPGPSPAVYRAALEASPSAILVTDSDGLIVLANPEAERLFGCDPGTLRGRPIEGMLPYEQRAAHAAQRKGFFARAEARPMAGGNRKQFHINS